jgi:hypothetical protein
MGHPGLCLGLEEIETIENAGDAAVSSIPQPLQ